MLALVSVAIEIFLSQYMIRRRKRKEFKDGDKPGSTMHFIEHCRLLFSSLMTQLSSPLAAVLFALTTHWPPILADGLSEAQIKAAYLYNFAKFAEWPADALASDGDILLCVVGSNVLDGAIDDLNGRNIGDHHLQVVQRNYADPSLIHCHMLFIGNSEQQRFLVLLKALHDAPVLTLSDIEDFSEKGGGIGLLFRNNKVVFEVNLEPIRNARLRLPSQLLNIASYVYGR